MTLYPDVGVIINILLLVQKILIFINIKLILLKPKFRFKWVEMSSFNILK